MLEAIQSPQYVDSRHRIFRQLVEALIYEKIVRPITNTLEGGGDEFIIAGQDEAGRPVHYLCEGKRKLSFGRIRLSDKPVRRVQEHKEQEAIDLAIFLYEISPFLDGEAKNLRSFVNELEQTVLKETFAKFYRLANKHDEETRNYDDLEGDVMEGHPYHPCFKSRIGFDLGDNEAYGPDYNPIIKLLWLAVRKEYMTISSMQLISYPSFIQHEIGAATFSRFVKMLEWTGYTEADYILVPVHPWQWREQIAGIFYRYVADGRIVLLGEGADEYTPQQSIRTLSNKSDSYKSNVKLSLSIVNTSSMRTITPRHARNGPIVSDRLRVIMERDAYLRDELRVIMLKEVLGVSFRYELLPEPVQQTASGTLGALWRESIHGYLEDGEEAVPFTALCHISDDGRPFIEPWIDAQGLEQWLRDLLKITIRPLIHLLYAHGVAVESHGQNTVLIHKQGVPVRLAVKDFSGGVLLYNGHDADAATLPETDKHAEVRDVVHNSLFFVNLTELALFLEEHYDFSEYSFWHCVADTIYAYQSEFAYLAEQFVRYDLFEESVEVGQLARRRLMDGQSGRDHPVSNVLHSFKSCKEG